MPDITKILLSLCSGSSACNATTVDCQSTSLSMIDSGRSPVIDVPGAMHGCRVMAEPESMDERDMAGIGPNKGRVYLLQYESIDEETQAGDLTGKIDFESNEPVELGGFSDIYKGAWRHRVSIDNQTWEAETPVAIKLLRAFTKRKVDLGRAKKHLRKEVKLWRRLRHDNIARFYGVTFHFEGRPAVVMQWYKNGTAPKYLEHQSESKKVEIVKQVAQGLKYLHVEAGHVVHGDIKGNNILISDDGYALLSDFGLAGFVSEFAGAEHTTTSLAGSLRWQAPELLLDEQSDDVSPKTLESDIWAFACTVFELLDGRLPYHWHKYDYAVIRAICNTSQKPVREKDDRSRLSTSLADSLVACWSHKTERPSIEEVVDKLEKTVEHADDVTV